MPNLGTPKNSLGCQEEGGFTSFSSRDPQVSTLKVEQPKELERLALVELGGIFSRGNTRICLEGFFAIHFKLISGPKKSFIILFSPLA